MKQVYIRSQKLFTLKIYYTNVGLVSTFIKSKVTRKVDINLTFFSFLVSISLTSFVHSNGTLKVI